MSATTNLTLHQCLACGALDAACIDNCAKCLSSDMITVETAGRGLLVSWTTIRKPPLKFKSEGSYHVGVFDLDNRVRVTGRFLFREGDKIGDRVVAVSSENPQHTSPTFKVEKNG